MGGKNLSFESRRKSFVYAFDGLWVLIKEPNAVLHAIITLVVVIAAVVCHFTIYKWIALVFAIGLVWVTEALNTAVELLCDHACEGKYHPAIKVIKDVAAGAVLLAAMTSAVIGIIVFLF